MGAHGRWRVGKLPFHYQLDLRQVVTAAVCEEQQD